MTEEQKERKRERERQRRARIKAEKQLSAEKIENPTPVEKTVVLDEADDMFACMRRRRSNY